MEVSIWQKTLYIYILDKKEAVDIDDAEDFEVAKALLKGANHENIG